MGRGGGSAGEGGAGGRPRLRVGYLTTDFGDHPTSHLMRSMWRLQRELGRVHAICFARSNDGSAQRAFIERTCEEFVDLSPSTGGPPPKPSVASE